MMNYCLVGNLPIPAVMIHLEMKIEEIGGFQMEGLF
jgi:hypothetical protein